MLRFLPTLVLGLALCAVPISAGAVTYVFENSCSEDQVNNSGVGDGSTDSAATGFAHVRVSDDKPSKPVDGSERVYYDVSWNGLETLLQKIHVHGPAPAGSSNPGHVFDVFSDEDEILAAGVDQTTDSIQRIESLFQLMLESGGLTTGVPADHLQFMLDGEAYVNVHTVMWPGGEIRCQLNLINTADGQTKDQQKCTNAMIKGVSKVSGAHGKQVCSCIKDQTKDKLTVTVEACIVPGAKVGTQQTKVSDDFTKRCTGQDKDGIDRLPGYGVSDDTTVNAAGTAKDADLMHAIFGPDLDVAIAGAGDPVTGSCQVATAKAAKKCQTTKLKEYAKCIKSDLRGKVGVEIIDDLGFEICMGEDRKGKIAKACDPVTGKLRGAIDKSCASADLATSLAGCGEAAAADAAACVDARVECEVCLALNATNAVANDCDLFDDGVANASCS